jgi:hypothetical protein
MSRTPTLTPVFRSIRMNTVPSFTGGGIGLGGFTPPAPSFGYCPGNVLPLNTTTKLCVTKPSGCSI